MIKAVTTRYASLFVILTKLSAHWNKIIPSYASPPTPTPSPDPQP